MPDRTSHRREDRILFAVFALALVTHAFLVTRNWSVGFMLLHEFRQTQTALISHFIDREDNFSLLYEAPIVGKPWVSVLLEVPVYEWSVVLVSRCTGWPLVVAARSVSLACFYLTIPALWWLFGRLGMARPRRMVSLGLVMVSPVYIFYTRSFLMESMVLMCCAWFLVGFVGMMERRRWTWFLLATVAGTGAALIKSATFAVWLIPAAAYAAWLLWRDVRSRTGWSAPLCTTFWGFAGVIVPLGLLHLWIRLTDPIKAVHASAWIFTSTN
ncbi:MAG TPA: glycosyltransferase family 39 protein, partial [Lacunisphaera sp.]|nr:glycosyltransferase family 39 protein [Lacunisphaera sp.]